MIVVLRSDIGLDDAWSVVGVFSSEIRATEACRGAGHYMLARCIPDRVYRTGTMLDVNTITVVSGAQVTPAKWPRKP